jgi:steroid delta-isomerase-like uncharacterized protein
MGIDADLRRQREALVLEHITAENQNDVEAALKTFTRPKYDMRSLGGGIIEGPDLVREHIAGFAVSFPAVTYVAEKIHHADDAVIVQYRITGTHQGQYPGIPANGAVIDHPAVAFFEFDGPDLVGERVYMDNLGLQAQLRGEAS